MRDAMRLSNKNFRNEPFEGKPVVLGGFELEIRRNFSLDRQNLTGRNFAGFKSPEFLSGRWDGLQDLARNGGGCGLKGRFQVYHLWALKLHDLDSKAHKYLRPEALDEPGTNLLLEMEMDIDQDANSGGRSRADGKSSTAIMAMMVGAPGSGKSTFCDRVMSASSRHWVRVCQDTIGNGKTGTKAKCLTAATTALGQGKSVFIDRCNLDREQRADFMKLGGHSTVEKHAVVLDLPAKVCISRSVKRTGHEGNLQGGKSAAVVNRMLQKKELPVLSEGFARITFCQDEKDVEAAIDTYCGLDSSDSLPSGCFGQRTPNVKIQLGIMRFLKKVDPAGENGTSTSAPASNDAKNSEELETAASTCVSTYSHNVPTLAFPSISTADFQFNLEKASDIIVDKVEEFADKLGNARLVLVDLSRESKILSMVNNKAAKKNIDPNKFFTFVGDITQLHSVGGLHCNVIANAANWRLKPGGGGTNAAIFNAAGKGCKILSEAYSSLFDGFASVIRSQGDFYEGSSFESQDPQLRDSQNCSQKVKREADFESTSKKCKSFPKERGPSSECLLATNCFQQKDSNKTWGSWAQALYDIAMHPENYKNDVLEASCDVVVLNDKHPKAQKHLLVLARVEGLDQLKDICKEHIPVLETMHAVGLKWAEKFLNENESLIFRLGYHSEPSMRQLHLHVISQDFNSKNLKNKKHWNSFNTPFFRDSVDVIEEVSQNGKATRRDDEEKLLAMELRCHRCRSAHPNIPRLKAHVTSCLSPFPSFLLGNGRLVAKPSKLQTNG
ncbi:unnamed protein product [Cuscuta campestris]|uniref:Aprataxin C2HE/C2H2/C2HC zinc finger domain-containing protein n=1 Tax=Cuscuta campestris TaxID=132261 RepID=A0A484L4F9_9ASTE|nr:unnamed protein product [Cuscuta campestris]